MIAVFGYAFPHRKTQDFLIELFLAGERNVVVLAAPPVALPSIDRASYWPTTLRFVPPLDTASIAKRLGYECRIVPHNKEAAVAARDAGTTLGIVAGARILKREVIDAFEEGIVNFHPGPIPQTSGLNAFFYTIKSGANAGVTTHYIDPRVDAGERTAFHPVRVGPSDTPEAVVENTYRMQMPALRQFLTDRKAGALVREAVDRPRANSPMSPEEKVAVLELFPHWRASRSRAFATADLHEACRRGDTAAVETILSRDPDLIEARTPEGWTPLILAVHGAHKPLAETLLGRGADPNATGRNGTTVLMYAKTHLVGHERPDLSLLDRLIEAGADPSRHDKFGRQLIDYVRDDEVIYHYFLQIKHQ